MSLRESIIALQQRVGVTADGVMGPQTIAAVMKRLDALEGVKPVEHGLADPSAFFASVRASFGPLRVPQVEGFNALLGAFGAAGWPVSWAAYGLATAWHEVDRSMQPIPERGGDAYFHRMYDITGDRPQVARDLGNTEAGDGIKFHGRGYVQLTGRSNYLNAGMAMGADLVGNPDLALQPDIAARVMVWGMGGGKFTGKGLKHYLPEAGPADRAAFVEARRIINRLDRAQTIAEHAVKFQAALLAGRWS